MADEFFGETADDDEMTDLQDTLTGSANTGLSDDGAIPGDEADADDEPLGNPADFPPELQGHWARMSRAYQQRLAELRSREQEMDTLRNQAQMVNQFNANPHAALQQMAAQYGYRLEQGNQPSQHQPGGANTGDIPQYVQQAAQQALQDMPDLQFMAPILSKTVWSILEPTLKPLQEGQQRQIQSQAQADYRQAVEQLDVYAPGWQQYESEMSNRWNFLRDALNGGSLRHPQYGSVLQMLYQWSAGEGRNRARVGREMADAARQRTATGRSTRTPRPNVQDRIRGAKTMNEQVEIAMRDAMQELGIR